MKKENTQGEGGEAGSLDLVLGWSQEEGARRQGTGDSVAVLEEEQGAEASRVHSRPDAPFADPPALVVQEVVPTEDEAGPDTFEWTEEREKALADALETTPEGSPTRVHRQIEAIAAALEAGELERPIANALIAEVETYLSARLQAEARKPPTTHADFEKAREEKTNALIAWQEATTALRSYVGEPDPLQLKLARYAAEQGHAFFESAWDLLMTSEPNEEESS